jgi:peptidoglycan/LPS O-acetylase OafA/YrhL
MSVPASALVVEPYERFAFIHGLRGVASLLVVWSHLSGFWLLSNARTSAAQDAWYQFIVRPFHLFQNGGHLGVVLFFLISGFIITHTSLRETRRSFAIRRSLRIFPPLAFATIVAGLLLLLANATGTELLGINAGPFWHWLAGSVLVDGFLPGGRAIDVTWTLVVEILFYTLTFAFIGLSRSRPVLATWIMIGVWAVLSVLSVSVGFVQGSTNQWTAVYVAFLLFGRAAYLWKRGFMRPLDAVLAGAVVIALYGMFVETLSPGFLMAPGGWIGLEPAVTYAYAVIIFLLLMQLAPRRTIQPFTLLGDVSYSLYLLHLPVGVTVLNLLDRIGVPETVNSIVAVLVSVLVSWGAYLIIERPSQRIARRLTRRRPVAEPDTATLATRDS